MVCMHRATTLFCVHSHEKAFSVQQNCCKSKQTTDDDLQLTCLTMKSFDNP